MLAAAVPCGPPTLPSVVHLARHASAAPLDAATRAHVPGWPSTLALADGLLACDRAALARAITLIESTRPDHRAQADVLLNHVLSARGEAPPSTGLPSLPGAPSTFRIGIAGPPGAGKSSLIEALGSHILRGTGEGSPLRLAVVAVDPSSTRTGGSILGDKTRMESLARHPAAYVRPSPTRGALGGIARDTADVVQLCEAGGHGVVLVETVGTGQSETAVESVVDMLLLVVPPAGGDELQGVKKGIVELADLIVVNKADGELLGPARRASSEYARALQLVRPKTGAWKPKVLRVSAVTGDGVPELWATCNEFRAASAASGDLLSHRAAQAVQCMWADFEAALLGAARGDARLREGAERLTRGLAQGRITSRHAAEVLLADFLRGPSFRSSLSRAGYDHTRMLPSRSPDASRPLGSTARAFTQSVCSSTASHTPVEGRHTRIVLS